MWGVSKSLLRIIVSFMTILTLCLVNIHMPFFMPRVANGSYFDERGLVVRGVVSILCWVQFRGFDREIIS